MVVLLGLRTAAAFRISVVYFEPMSRGSATVYVVPHPSGINRWYNSRWNVKRMARFMRHVARKLKGASR